LKEEEPIGYYKDLPIQKGAGRYGPFVKWDGKFFNISKKKYDPDTVDEAVAIEIIQAKLERDAAKIIKDWPEENVKIEMGRWGPFIRFGKKNVPLPKKDKKKITKEEAAELSLDEVKKIIKDKHPKA